MTDLPVFGRWLKQRRKARDLTQEAFAERVGCAVTTIRKIEAGVLRPSQQLAQLLADHLELAPADRATFLTAARARLPEKRARVTAVPTPPDAQSSPAGWPSTLPLPPTPLIGRTQDVHSVCALLQRADVRLLTLTGAGGVGKTRVALAVAAAVGAHFTDGVAFVALAPLSNADLVVPTMAQALNVTETSRQPLLERLQHELRTKQLLLVLDNFEHVVAAAPAIVDLLAGAPGLKVLVTSRAVLHLSGEQEYPLPPLAPSDAIALFVARAQAATPAFALSATNAASVAAICARLDGLPLAIELAAPRLKLFAPAALQTWLEHRLNVLTGGARDLPARQHTMRSTIDWSYQLLDEAEQTLFRRMGVFAGGCTLDAAAAVCAASTELPIGLVDGIAALVDKSLLRRDTGAGDEPRFVMLETIRAYALERLTLGGEAAAVRRCHADYFLALAQRTGYPPSDRPPQVWIFRAPAWLFEMEAEHANLQAALAWATDNEPAIALRLAAALWPYWNDHGYFSVGQAWLERCLETPEREPGWERAQALFGAAGMAYWQGRYEAAQRYLEASRAMFEALGEREWVAAVMNVLGLSALMRGDADAAQQLWQQSLTMLQQLGNATLAAVVLSNLGQQAKRRGEYESARELLEQSVALFREQNNTVRIYFPLQGLADIALLEARNRQAEAYYVDVLELLGARRNRLYLDHALEGVAMARWAHAPDGPTATHTTRLFGAAAALRTATNTLQTAAEAWQARYEATLDVVRSMLGAARFAAAWAEGQGLTRDQAIAYALDDAHGGAGGR